MIREFTPSDTDAVIRIWLEAFARAHCFIEAGFWVEREADMRDIYLTQSRNLVCEEKNGVVVGFISLLNNYIAALFVEPSHQGRGIGFQLLEKAKELHKELELAVYKENRSAVVFYLRQGFEVVGEGIEPKSGHPELKMRYGG